MKSKAQQTEANDSTKIPEQKKTVEKTEHQPQRLNIPGFIKEEVGLGDVIKRVTYAAGIKPCSGCGRRAAALNRWLVFSPRHPK